jgi:hypothetical protein
MTRQHGVTRHERGVITMRSYDFGDTRPRAASAFGADDDWTQPPPGGRTPRDALPSAGPGRRAKSGSRRGRDPSACSQRRSTSSMGRLRVLSGRKLCRIQTPSVNPTQPVLPLPQVLQLDPTSSTKALPGVLDPCQETGIALELVVEPIVVGPEPDQDSGRPAMAGDDNLLLPRLPEIA